MTKPSKGFLNRRQRRAEIEVIAQEAALEDLKEFYEAVQAARVIAEKAAFYMGGHTEARYQRVMDSVEDAIQWISQVSTSSTAAASRAGRRMVTPLYELAIRNPAPKESMVRSPEDLVMPLAEAERMRENGATWREVRSALLVEKAS